MHTCYKIPLNPSATDFQKQPPKVLVETGLSDFLKMTVTVLKTYFKKGILKQLAIETISTVPLIFSCNLYLYELGKIQVCNEIPALPTYLDV